MKKTSKAFDPSRRELFKHGAAVAAGVVAASTLARIQPAQAAAPKVAQATAMYQTTPHGKQQCDGCVHFIPGKTATADGTCKMVAGSISPHGWCVLFATKA